MPGGRLAFVTHNTKDFSQPGTNEKLPHADIAEFFFQIKSRYYINLAEALRRVEPALVSDLIVEQEWTQEPRRIGEISDAISELLDKVWYNRHQVRLEKIESGEIKLVEKETYPITSQRAPANATSGKARGNPPGAWRKNTASKASAPGMTLNGEC